MSATEFDFPGSDVYAGAETAANTAYQTAVTRLNQQRSTTLNQYGYLGDVDPTSGALSNVRVDPNNPYGQYQQLLRSSAQEGMSAHDAAAGRGLSGGLAQQGETQSQYDYGQGASNLGNTLQNTLGGYDTNQVDAENQRTQSVTQAQEEAAANALQWQLSQAQLGAAQTAVTAGGGGDGGGTNPTGTGGANTDDQLQAIAKMYGLSTTTPNGPTPLPSASGKTPKIPPSLINQVAKLVK